MLINKKAFTLAEMMVVMLILTVILAAFAPMMTKRRIADLGSPWLWTSNNRDIYFGLDKNQSVMIGQDFKGDNNGARLMLNIGNKTNERDIVFLRKKVKLAELYIPGGSNLLFGSSFHGSNGVFNSTESPINNTAYGISALQSVLKGDGANNVAIGTDAMGATGENVSQNVAVGSKALQNIKDFTGGGTSDSVGIGYQAGAALGSISLGDLLYSDDLTGRDVAVGSNALAVAQSGYENVAVGMRSLMNATKSIRNTAIGALSMLNSTTGEYNTAVGSNALKDITSENYNTAVGASALEQANHGQYNTAVGYKALSGANLEGAQPVDYQSYNTAVGAESLFSNTMGYNNQALGYKSLYSNTEGYNNIALGYEALKSNTTGNNNIAIGNNALSSREISSSNVAVGNDAMLNINKGDYNTSLGNGALKGVFIENGSSIPSGAQSYNVAIGNNALHSDKFGAFNTALGHDSLYSNTDGYNNVALGYQSLYSNTVGDNNVASGYQSLYSNTEGNRNVALGYQSLYSNTEGHNSVALGYQSLNNNTEGDNNIALGYQSLNNNTTGHDNIALGYNSLSKNTIGDNNVAFGTGACHDIGSNANNVTCIGDASGPKGYGSSTLNSTELNNMAYSVHVGKVGTSSADASSVYIARRYSKDSTAGQGGNVYIGGKDSTITIGQGYLSDVLIGQQPSSITKYYIRVLSDIPSGLSGNNPAGIHIGGSGANVFVAGRSLACNGKFPWEEGFVSCTGSIPSPPSVPGGGGGTVSYMDLEKPILAYTLSDIRKKDVNGEYVDGLEQIRQMTPKKYTYKDDKQKFARVGLIAQDLEKIMPDAVKKGQDGFLRISNEHIKYALVNAVKQLDSIIQNLISQVKEIADKILCLDKRINGSAKENKDLQDQIEQINKRLNDLEKASLRNDD